MQVGLICWHSVYSLQAAGWVTQSSAANLQKILVNSFFFSSILKFQNFVEIKIGIHTPQLVLAATFIGAQDAFVYSNYVCSLRR